MLLQEALSNPHNGSYPTIAIDGPGGSGKTTLARQLIATKLKGLCITHGDDYFEPFSDDMIKPDEVPGYFNANRFIDEVGTPVQNGSRILKYRPYDWSKNTIVNTHLVISSGLVHEGIKSFGLPIKWDTKIWIEATREIRRQRCLFERSDDERRAKGHSPKQLLERFEYWASEAEQYKRLVNPETNADYIINGEDSLNEILEDLFA